MDDGSLGTDAERVRAAIEHVRSPDGVLVLMDLGSALMSAEMATEMLEAGGGPSCCPRRRWSRARWPRPRARAAAGRSTRWRARRAGRCA